MQVFTSLDPRINRAELPVDPDTEFTPKQALDQTQTYEVFHQVKTGGHHSHVGSVHAPTAELALAFAKEQYGRRGQCVSLWVVNSSAIAALDVRDSDIFDTATDKPYREVTAYANTREKIEAFKNKQQA